ncbi:hypothetical protein GQ473_07455 [archaeon]|nr:hypothetical protein [archaeon]
MNLNSVYRNVADKAVDAISDISIKTGLNKFPEKIVVLPQYLLPKGVIAAVGETYDSTKTLFLNAQATYNIPYNEFKGILTHEMTHLWEMCGGKLSEILTPQNAYQEALLDGPLTDTSANEGRVNLVAKKLSEKFDYGTEILTSAYAEATTYFSGLMSVAAKMPDVDAYHRITDCSNCNKYGC